MQRVWDDWPLAVILLGIFMFGGGGIFYADAARRFGPCMESVRKAPSAVPVDCPPTASIRIKGDYVYCQCPTSVAVEE